MSSWMLLLATGALVDSQSECPTVPRTALRCCEETLESQPNFQPTGTVHRKSVTGELKPFQRTVEDTLSERELRHGTVRNHRKGE